MPKYFSTQYTDRPPDDFWDPDPPRKKAKKRTKKEPPKHAADPVQDLIATWENPKVELETKIIATLELFNQRRRNSKIKCLIKKIKNARIR